MKKDRPARRMTGRHVLFWFVGFFAVVFIANGFFVYFATKSWTGLETEDAYNKGLEYNREIEAAEMQHGLGWAAGLSLVPRGNGLYRLSAEITDAEGAPVFGLEVEATLKRPVQDGMDQSVMLESVGGGAYKEDVALPVPGQWDVVIEARGLEGEKFVVEKRFIVQ
jgi:nitrogen fixation protein FixH